MKSLDTLYSVPLLALVGLVLLARLPSSRQHLWVLAPLAFIYTVPLALFTAVPQFSEKLFGLSGNQLQHLLATYFGSLAILWLLSDLLARMKRWQALPASLIILGVAGSFGAVNYVDRHFIVSEITAFVVVVVASFAAAGALCSKRYSALKFLGLLFTFNVVFMLIAWPPIWSARLLFTFRMPPDELLAYLPHTLLIAVIDGIGLFILLIPFFLVATRVPLYRRQFARILNLPVQDTQEWGTPFQAGSV